MWSRSRTGMKMVGIRREEDRAWPGKGGGRVLAHLGFHSDGWKGRRRSRRWSSAARWIWRPPLLLLWWTERLAGARDGRGSSRGFKGSTWMVAKSSWRRSTLPATMMAHGGRTKLHMSLLDLQRKEGRTKRHRAYLCQHWRPSRLGRMHVGRDRERRQAACPCAHMQADRQARQLAEFF
jgi:hypothetical protein